ncbi:hypothetical protein EN852_005845 [Mesorhizobium sp. M2E.F.Ca.ET.209.01.1.1]|nr:hypothetical protein EN852_005845 [Mesorhizobium sp. M2E.F.Ca.ET.209.01.1.1]
MMISDTSMLWFRLAQFDIRLRYRNSTFGPLWITLNTAIFAASVGFLYAVLLNQPIKEYLHHLATSIVLWQFLSATVVEGAESVINANDLILNTKMSPASCVFRCVTKNFIILLHNLVVVAVTMVIAYPNVGLNFPMFFIGVGFLIIHATWISFIVAVVSARFRDVPLITASAMQLLFILSPILWASKVLPSGSLFLVLNPVSYMIDAARTPVLNGGTDYTSVLVSAAIALLGSLAAHALYRRTQHRIPYWL